MTPCSNQQKGIALLAVGELEERSAQALRDHLTTCAGCRAYLESITAVAGTLASVEPRADIETSETFHRSVMNRLRREERSSWWRKAAELWLATKWAGWRLALPLAAALILLFFNFIIPRNSSVTRPARPSSPPAATVAAAPATMAVMAPTLANYLNAASASPQQLDDLLTAQAQKALPPVPADAASMLALANAMD
jgi:hypothetical protein